MTKVQAALRPLALGLWKISIFIPLFSIAETSVFELPRGGRASNAWAGQRTIGQICDHVPGHSRFGAGDAVLTRSYLGLHVVSAGPR
jgi:hypothetical protein